MSPVAGVGIDVIGVARIRAFVERHGERLREIFTPGEIDYCRSRRRWAESFAVRFAAKEAVLKAIGDVSGFSADWHEIEVVADAGGRPGLALHGRLARCARAHGIRAFHLSLTHGGEHAIAQVVAERGAP